jgi:hypothetical protein
VRGLCATPFVHGVNGAIRTAMRMQVLFDVPTLVPEPPAAAYVLEDRYGACWLDLLLTVV